MMLTYERAAVQLCIADEYSDDYSDMETMQR